MSSASKILFLAPQPKNEKVAPSPMRLHCGMARRLSWFLLLLPTICRCALAQSDTNFAAQPPLRTASLPAQVRNDIVAVIAKDIATDPVSGGIAFGRTVALGSLVGKLHLSQIGPAAILIRSGPDDPFNGATGNGEFWLFRRVQNHAVFVLKAGGYEAAPLRGAYHHGMLDIRTAWNLSCCDGVIEVYRFDGVRYQPAYCSSYRTDDTQKMTEGSRRKCSGID
jgi:hypothetical protein